jgi:hypothetical protein
MEARPVLSKLDFVERYVKGEFGNTGDQWQTLEAFLQSGYQGLVHLRNRNAGGKTYYNVKSNRVAQLWSKVAGNGAQASPNWYLAAMAPHKHNLLQGEAQLRPEGLCLYYSTAKNLPMRDALRQAPQYARGIIALGLLKWALCSNSYEWLQVLFDRYPEHVVEFSTFSRNWGNLPNYNTAFWEIRLY